MKLAALLCVFLPSTLCLADLRIARISAQPVHASDPAPNLLAEVKYDATLAYVPEVINYEPPEIPEGAELLRVGVYDAASRRWLSSTSVVSAGNFAKGFAPNLMLATDALGEVISASCRGVRIDAGQTRDFGPKATVQVTQRGKQPDLNKPVVLSPEGKKVAEEEEKTMLQKYWWVLAIAVFVMLTSGGDQK